MSIEFINSSQREGTKEQTYYFRVSVTSAHQKQNLKFNVLWMFTVTKDNNPTHHVWEVEIAIWWLVDSQTHDVGYGSVQEPSLGGR